MTPLVSVVVPTYDSARFIEATMQSILDSTLTDFELLVSDHSSTDGTWDLLQQYVADDRVRLNRLVAGGGASANWNAVSSAARGRFLKLVCGDDLITRTCLAEQVAALTAHPDAVLAACRRDILDARGRPLIRGRGLGPLRGVVDGSRAIRSLVTTGTNLLGEPACVLFRRDAFVAAGMWADRSYLIDEATYVGVLRSGPLVAMPATLAGFRVSDQQWSVRLMRTQAAEAKDFHRAVADADPGLLTAGQLRIGNLRADLAALQRRLAYVWWRSRMRGAD